MDVPRISTGRRTFRLFGQSVKSCLLSGHLRRSALILPKGVLRVIGSPPSDLPQANLTAPEPPPRGGRDACRTPRAPSVRARSDLHLGGGSAEPAQGRVLRQPTRPSQACSGAVGPAPRRGAMLNRRKEESFASHPALAGLLGRSTGKWSTGPFPDPSHPTLHLSTRCPYSPHAPHYSPAARPSPPARLG
jgi:hypothetical protein